MSEEQTKFVQGKSKEYVTYIKDTTEDLLKDNGKKLNTIIETLVLIGTIFMTFVGFMETIFGYLEDATKSKIVNHVGKIVTEKISENIDVEESTDRFANGLKGMIDTLLGKGTMDMDDESELEMSNESSDDVIIDDESTVGASESELRQSTFIDPEDY